VNRVLVERDVVIPARDGTQLGCDVYRPAEGGPFPVLLNRTHYGKGGAVWLSPIRAAGQGYAVVVNDMRGQFSSGGEFDPFVTDVEDSYDVVEWCARQPWSTGKVGMFGSSSGGFVQLLAALSGAPHLTAIAPMQSWASFGRGNVYEPGGGFSLFMQEWALLQAQIDPEHRLAAAGAGYEAARQRASRAASEIGRWHRHRPLREFPPLPRELAPYYHRWLERPELDEAWRRLDVSGQYARIQVPALHLVGWFDRFSIGTLDNFTGIRAGGGSPLARDNQKIVIGPWPHGVPVRTESGDQWFGPAAFVDVPGLVLRWYDHWLKGEENGIMAEPRVRLYTLGEGAWHELESWPPPRSRTTPYYLHSGGRANTRHGDGRLDATPPGSEPADAYVYDPADPTPSVPGRISRPVGSVDQRPIEERSDVLVYSTPPLAADLEVTGDVEARLWARTSAPDTDWAVKLCDVHPDGSVLRLSDGMIRARYRRCHSRATPLRPGELAEYAIRLRPVSNLFRRGHRIRVEVASASFPQFDPNPNTGGLVADEACGVPATQLVLHDAEHPSHVLLPVAVR
jgi:putative CocE/NonD family hydrolase